jgi:DNA polymerase-3 subunit beta
MKVTVTQENLSKALNTVSRVASSRTTLPILSSILIRTDNSQLILATTNLEIAITESINAKIDSDGVVTVPARLITEFVQNLPKVNIDIELQDNKLLIKAGHYTSTINTTNVDDFPALPEIKSKSNFKIASDILKTAASQVIVATSNDTTRPILTGVYMHTYEGNLYITATDGYRLAERKIMPFKHEVSLIIPATTLNDVLRVINDDTPEVEVKINDEQVCFEAGSVKITSKVIDGTFINYRQLIPTSTDNSAELDHTEFLRVVKISELFARESAGSIVIKANKNTLEIKSITTELGDNSSQIDGKIKGDGSITLNSRYLIDAINCIQGDVIRFNFSGKLAPSLITGADDDYKHIIMPVKS